MVSGVKMTHLNIPVPEVLNTTTGNRSKNYDVFKQKWINYSIATGIDEKPEKQKLATLLSIIGSEALEIYNTFEWTNDTDRTTEAVMNKLEKFCKPKRNFTYERYILMTRKQASDEKIDDFVKDLRILADSCEYGLLKESIIKDVFVLGVHDNKLREHFLKDSTLDLDKAIEIGRASEKAMEQSSLINDSRNVNIMKINDTQKRTQREKIQDCRYCGREHFKGRDHCFAWGKSCNKCHGKNHFGIKCRRMPQTNEVKEIHEDDEEGEYYVS